MTSTPDDFPVDADHSQCPDEDFAPPPDSEPAPTPRASWCRTTSVDPRNPLADRIPLAMQAPHPIDQSIVREALRQLMHEAHRNASEKGFWFAKTPDSHAAEKICLMHSELSEALEALRVGRWIDQAVPLNEEGQKKLGCTHEVVEGVVTELADCLIRIFDLCQAAHLPLAAALLAKLERNRDRAPMHGKGF
jgi:hypothetical protein